MTDRLVTREEEDLQKNITQLNFQLQTEKTAHLQSKHAIELLKAQFEVEKSKLENAVVKKEHFYSFLNHNGGGVVFVIVVVTLILAVVGFFGFKLYIEPPPIVFPPLPEAAPRRVCADDRNRLHVVIPTRDENTGAHTSKITIVVNGCAELVPYIKSN